MSKDSLYGLLPSFINKIDEEDFLEGVEEDVVEEVEEGIVEEVKEGVKEEEVEEEGVEEEVDEEDVDEEDVEEEDVDEEGVEEEEPEKKIIFLKERNNIFLKVEKIIPEEEKEEVIEERYEETIEITKQSIKLCVYDNYTFDFNKYPRKKSDIIIIIFLLHEQFLIKLSETYDYAVQQYHQCKEYFHIFKFEPYKESRKYSAKDIIFLINKTNEYFIENANNYHTQLNYLHRFHILDQIYYFYIRNKNFYLQLYKNIHEAKKAHFECRVFSYTINIPTDFYDFDYPQTYTAMELMEINTYAQYLIQNKIIKNLPIPKYVK
jgi:hypothetical protein